MAEFGSKLAIGSDHAGFALKETIKAYLVELQYTIYDFGTFSSDSMDYADVAHPLSEAVEKGEYLPGILLCGSGNGVNMTANKHRGIRSALCWLPEIARLARLHNDANVLAIPARFTDEATALEIVRTFLSTPFEGGRHCQRIEKISVTP